MLVICDKCNRPVKYNERTEINQYQFSASLGSYIVMDWVLCNQCKNEFKEWVCSDKNECGISKKEHHYTFSLQCGCKVEMWKGIGLYDYHGRMLEPCAEEHDVEGALEHQERDGI